MMKRYKTLLTLAVLAAATFALVVPAQAGVVTVAGVTGHDGGNWGPWHGHLTDMLNGLYPGTMGPDPADHKPMIDTSADPEDPSVWTYAGNDWKGEYKANSRLAGAGDAGADPPVPAAINNKIGWAVLDLGSEVSGLENMYLWNVKFQNNTENVDTYNIYYSVGAGIDALPAMPQSKGKTGDYDFSSGDWTLLNGGGPLTLPQNTSNNSTPQSIVPLNGIEAQYIGIEMLTAGDATKNRIGIAQIELTFTESTIVEGDFNSSDSVDQDDLSLLLAHWGATEQPPGWTSNWDGQVEQSELSALLSNWGAGASAAAVPEPSTFVLLGLASLSLLAWRRRK